jgi:hypothetical protein
MSKIVSGMFTASDAAVNVECGFVPDYVRAWSALTGTELVIEWFKCLADASAGTSGQYGCLDSAGAKSMCQDAANGIIPYSTASNMVLIDSPVIGTGKVAVAIADWTSSLSTAATARSTTAIGTMVRPTTHNGRVYECTTAGTSSGTEPTTWTTTVGGTVTDNDVVFTCREEETIRSGCHGFTIGVTLSTNGELWVFKAEKHDMTGNLGDADATDPVRF